MSTIEVWQSAFPPESLRHDAELGIVAIDDGDENVATPASSTWQSPRTDLSVIGIRGGDAMAFLHSQFSGDIQNLPVGAAMQTAWCSPQGKVLFLPWIVRDTTWSYLLVPRDSAESMIKRLRMFVLRADVTIDDLSQEHAIIDVRGLADPTLDDAVVGTISTEHHWIITTAAALRTTWHELGFHGRAEADSLVADIHDHVPRLASTTSDQFLPQELDLEQRGGLSFDKGCFPGQEIIARVRYRGRVKRNLATLHVEGDDLLPAGTRITRDDKNCGTILMSARENGGPVQSLAVVDEGVTEAHAGTDAAPRLHRVGEDTLELGS